MNRPLPSKTIPPVEPEIQPVRPTDQFWFWVPFLTFLLVVASLR